MNAMRKARIAKLTLNIGAGKDQSMLEKGAQLIEQLAGIPPVKTRTQKRIPSWGLRPGLSIGLKLTLRGKKAEELLPRLLSAKQNKLQPGNFDANGNVSFGIQEYIDIEGAKYDPKIGIIGLQVCVTLERPGYRIKKRRIRPARVGDAHRLTAADARAFMNEQFNVTVEEEE